MKERIRKSFKSIAAALLALLGFASCGKEDIEDIFGGRQLVMYGSPSASFKALGTVKDPGGKPIEGIRVAIHQHTAPDINYDDTVYTDAKGTYLLERSVFCKPQNVNVVFEDVDGPDHGGEFAPAKASPDIKQTQKGDGLWFEGRFEAKADVSMKKK